MIMLGQNLKGMILISMSFDNLFSIEADKKGFKISGKQVVKLLSGEIRKPMVDFLCLS